MKDMHDTLNLKISYFLALKNTVFPSRLVYAAWTLGWRPSQWSTIFLAPSGLLCLSNVQKYGSLKKYVFPSPLWTTASNFTSQGLGPLNLNDGSRVGGVVGNFLFPGNLRNIMSERKINKTGLLSGCTIIEDGGNRENNYFHHRKEEE